MKKLFTLILVLLALQSASAQTYGNEWIVPGQSYYKLKVFQEGLYRITYEDLVSAGLPANIDSRRFQILHRGAEQAILVKLPDNSPLGTPLSNGDYIEFYGKGNDGTLDTELYIDPTFQAHKKYNLFSDTSAYFLTWNNLNSNKRMATFEEANIGNLNAEAFHLEEIVQVRSDIYRAGQVYPTEIHKSAFDKAEGWTGLDINTSTPRDYTFTLSNKVVSGPKPTLKIILMGVSANNSQIQIQVGASTSSLRAIGTTSLSGYEIKELDFTLEWSDLGTTSMVVRFSSSASRAAMAYTSLTYAQAINMSGLQSKTFQTQARDGGKSFVSIASAPNSTRVLDITDPNNVRIIRGNTLSGAYRFILNNTTANRRLMVLGATSTSVNIKKVTFRNIDPQNFNYIGISHASLTTPVSGSNNPVKEYMAYRASSPGGGFDTLLLLIDQVYDQFSYGEETPLGLRRFCLFAASQGPTNKYLFLMGKPIGTHSRASNQYYRKAPQVFLVKNLVPTLGYPASDIALSSKELNGRELEPQLLTGRLNARSAQDVKNYLEKIKEMEQAPITELWRKNHLYLSGGLTSFEIRSFQSYVNQFKTLIEGPYLGGSAEVYTKQTNNTVEVVNVAQEVNDGLNFVSFFGHASGQQTDIDIGFVSDNANGYSNKGKYPFFLINGCIAGIIEDPSVTTGEDWMLTPERGAVGFLAHANQGKPSELKQYTDAFLHFAYADSLSIGSSAGEIQKLAILKYISNKPAGVLGSDPNTHIQQMILQGDPAYKIFPSSQPDYSVKAEDVSFESYNNSPISALSDSFAIAIIAKNLGIVNNQKLQVTVNRTLPDGRIVYNDTIHFQPLYYQDTLLFPIRSLGASSFGLNKFEIILDLPDSIQEVNEANNSTTVEYFISLGGTVNLLPYDLALVNTNAVILKAQSADILSETREYLFEIDTVASFQSPFKKEATINARVLAEWSINLLSKDSLVYYWRTKYKNPNLPIESDAWSQSSFIYINSPAQGWNISAPTQWQQSEIVGLNQNPNTGHWSFQSGEVKISVNTFGSAHPSPFTDVEVSINDIPYLYTDRYCGTNSVNAIAFDKSSGEPYKILFTPGQFDILDPFTCGRRPQTINHFPNSFITNMADINIQKYFDGLGDGDFVLLFTIDSAVMSTFVARFRDELLNIGASVSVIDNLQNGFPYIILGRKGQAPGTAFEASGNRNAAISLNQNVITQYTQGSITSPLAGPALNWSNSRSHLAGVEDDDEFYYDIIGVDFNGEETVLFEYIEESLIDLSSVNASQYPYLKIRLNLFDEQQLTSAQAKRLLIEYAPSPEGFLLPEQEQIEVQEILQEGKNTSKTFRFTNISTIDFPDSIKVSPTFFNQNSRASNLKAFNIAPLKAGEDSLFRVDFFSRGKVGLNNLVLYVNPQTQTEQFYSNNIVSISSLIKVEADAENPLMEVTFDGQRIMNGDIVSPSPTIVVKMKDNNQFLLKQDTTGMELYLSESCEGCSKKRISFSSSHVVWTSATADQDFSIEYKPSKLTDGIYELEVQVSDESGNKSGSQPYSISFEVVNASSITHFYPYPNPFSTKMWFVFTLTGEEIPEQIKVQIMTVSGRVVREITQDELGPLRIGNNRSAYAWDGRDEFGDLLANGVYLYRVIVKSSGQTLDHRQTSADKAFEKGFGKLYILR